MFETNFETLDELLTVSASPAEKRVYVNLSMVTEKFWLDNAQEVDEFVRKLKSASKKAFQTKKSI